MKDCHKGSHVLVLHDTNEFSKSALNRTKKSLEEIQENKEILIEDLEIQTQMNEVEKMELVNSETIIKKCQGFNVLVLCFSYSCTHELNCILRSAGVYSELIMKNDFSDLHGGLINDRFPEMGAE